jgi:hypothetical protein
MYIVIMNRLQKLKVPRLRVLGLRFSVSFGMETKYINRTVIQARSASECIDSEKKDSLARASCLYSNGISRFGAK